MGILFEEKNILKQYDRVHEYSGFGLCLPVRGGGFCYDSRLAIEATDGKKTSLSIYLLYLLAMSGSGWTWYNSIHKARALAEGNRYTLATYEKVSGVIKGGHKVRQFGFYVDGVKYNTTTTYPKFLGVSNPLRIIVRYAVSNPEYNKALGDEFVPTWVLSPPERGWKQSPPAIHWEGAVLDSVYMQSLQGNN